MAQGSSIGTCIPRRYARVLSIESGDFLRMRLDEQRIIIEKLQGT